MKSSRILPFLLLPALVAFGCADPAADAPDATVQEAAPAPAVEATSEEAIEFDLGGKIEFVGSKVTGSHDGGFNSFEGTVTVADGTRSALGRTGFSSWGACSPTRPRSGGRTRTRPTSRT